MSFGTDFEAVKAHQATSEPYHAAEYTPLAGPINKLWQQHNFRSENRISGVRSFRTGVGDPRGAITDTIYERMKPALRLASLLHFYSSDFFIKICRASVVNHVLDPAFAADDNDVQAYKSMLVSLSDKMPIYMGQILDSRLINSNGKCSSYPDDRRPIYLQLNSDYLDWYSRPDYDAEDIQLQNMVACSLAFTLAHEHAHAVWQMRNHATYTAELWRIYRLLGSNEAALVEAGSNAYQEEPKHSSNDSEFELGLSWDRHWSGGLFPHFNGVTGRLHIQARTGTCWRMWDTRDDLEEPNYWVVAVHTYNQFFNQDAWDAEQVWQDKVFRGEEKSPVSGDEFQGGLALYLTPVKAIKSWPTYSLEYIEHFKKCLDAYAHGIDVNAVL
jgi:hypothetical protein